MPSLRVSVRFAHGPRRAGTGLAATGAMEPTLISAGQTAALGDTACRERTLMIAGTLAWANAPKRNRARWTTSVTPRRRFRTCPDIGRDRKSTRLNSSHVKISYAVF